MALEMPRPAEENTKVECANELLGEEEFDPHPCSEGCATRSVAEASRRQSSPLAHPMVAPPESSRLLSGEKPSHNNNNIVAVPAGKVVRFFLLFSLQSRLSSPVQQSVHFHRLRPFIH